jgi:hypothetical protein
LLYVPPRIAWMMIASGLVCIASTIPQFDWPLHAGR